MTERAKSRGRCPHCHTQDVFWANNSYGRRVLVDSRPDDRYGVFIYLPDEGRLVHPLDVKLPQTPDRYSLHRNTCLARSGGV